MQYSFADRMKTTPRSFIREILKVTENPEIISFAGGLPSPDLFATDEIAEVARAVVAEDGKVALQYTTTEGYPELREYISKRYKSRLGIDVPADQILITNGSQQCLDLIGKVFINKGDHVAIERPGYLGAIQAFSLFEPKFSGVPLETEGPDPAALASVLKRDHPKLFYGVQNSQNPSGVTWSGPRRKEIAEVIDGSGTMIVEDDAYGELRFDGKPLPPMYSYLPDQTILTGSFSKIVAPGLRVGWVAAPKDVIAQITVAKQGSDLHSNHVAQRIIARYLAEYPIDAHIAKIVEYYKKQRDVMVECVNSYFPEGVACTKPDGGMFVWAELPEGCSSMELFDLAIKEKVAILPGKPFYTDGGGDTTMRLNFSNQSEAKIREGMTRLSEVMREYLRENKEKIRN